MTTRILMFVANWSVCITGCIAVLVFCLFAISKLLDIAIKHLHFYGVMIDWITHRKNFKAWLSEYKADRGTQ